MLPVYNTNHRPVAGTMDHSLDLGEGIVADRPVDEDALRDAFSKLRRPFGLRQESRVGQAGTGTLGFLRSDENPGSTPPSGTRTAFVPALPVENLGDPGFLEEHGLRFAYVGGSMANGIASAEMVEAMAGAGMLGFFGAAGLTPAVVEAALDRLSRNLQGRPFGSNLIHSPQEPALESAIVDLYLRRGVRLVEASAFLDLTLPIVRYRVRGIGRDAAGRIVAPNKVVAKVSRVEVAAKFMAPPPASMLRELVRARRDHARAGRTRRARADGGRRDGRGRLGRPHG